MKYSNPWTENNPRKAVSKGIVNICNEDWNIANMTKKNGDMAAGVWVSLVWK